MGELSSNNICETASERTSGCGTGCAGVSGTEGESVASHKHVHCMHEQEAAVARNESGWEEENMFVPANTKPSKMARTTLTVQP